MFIIDPFASIMFVAAAVGLLFVISAVRGQQIRKGIFSNPSYQLGIVFGAVAWMFVTGVVGVGMWVVL